MQPGSAQQLLTTLTALTLSEAAAFQRIRDDLIALDIPDCHLPPTLADARTARETSTGPWDCHISSG